MEDVFRSPSLPVNMGSGSAAAGPGANKSSSNAGEDWVQQELQYYERAYSVTNELNVSVTTFNAGCKKPILPLTGLVSLTTAEGKPMDVIVIGFQEIDMSTTALFKSETDAATPWVQGMNAAIGADSNPTPNAGSAYFSLPPKQLVGLLLCVYVRRALLPYLKESAITTVATGALGSLGNKGGVGVHLVLHRTSLCLLTAHLAAGQSNVSKRNEDINTILKSMDFNATKRAEAQMTASNTGIIAELQYPELFPRDHDIVLVAGDLNYRLNLSYDQALEMANRNAVGELLQYDQLVAELRSPHTPWQGFIDLTPTFLPTYRYDIGTNTYDTSEKRRIPSYTDRILYWSKRKSSEALVKVDTLQAKKEIVSSDHKPVHAVMRVPISVEVPEEKAKVTTSLRDKVREMGLDRASSCKTTIDVTALDFGEQQFHHCGTVQMVNVTNTGDCVAIVKVLRQRGGGDDSEGTWLRVSPLDFALLPGESQTVTVETKVDPRCMTWLARWRPFDGIGHLSLSSILLLCVRNGPLHAVECKATLLPSVFGNALENVVVLSSAPCTVGYTQKADLAALQRTLLPQIPKEVWYLADVLARSPREPQLFTRSADQDACNALMAFLDTHAEPLPPDTDVHCAAECLLTFLNQLQEPVIPFAMYAAALAAGKAKGKAPLVFLRQLPTAHANVWIYIISLLNFLLRPEHARCNELNSSFLAQVFSSAMVQRPASTQGSQQARLVQGGGVDQQVRQQLQQEKEDAMGLVEYFLVTPPNVLQSS